MNGMESLIGTAGVGGAIAFLLIVWLTQKFDKRIDKLVQTNKDLKDAIVGDPMKPDQTSLVSEIRNMSKEMVQATNEMKLEFVKANSSKSKTKKRRK